jgi:hypothetical protein
MKKPNRKRFERLIIENRTHLDMPGVLPWIQRIVNLGRISNGPAGKQYCWHCHYDGVHYSAFRNKSGSDRIIAHYNGEQSDVEQK